jgi:rSAM/selenodomain-associated transferase 1
MTKNLVIVFVKKATLGSVKTRLAKTIGDLGALEVYKELLKITKNAVAELSCDVRIYFSETIDDDGWPNYANSIQIGTNIGERMYNAFKDGFEDGYKNIVLIGSDLPDISTLHIEEGLAALEKNQVVFGPAEDGGYYLIGLSQLLPEIFINKPWSQPHLLKTTFLELEYLNISFSTLEPLNDIDTYEDLIASDFYKNNTKLQEKIQQFND